MSGPVVPNEILCLIGIYTWKNMYCVILPRKNFYVQAYNENEVIYEICKAFPRMMNSLIKYLVKNIDNDGQGFVTYGIECINGKQLTAESLETSLELLRKNKHRLWSIFNNRVNKRSRLDIKIKKMNIIQSRDGAVIFGQEAYQDDTMFK